MTLSAETERLTATTRFGLGASSADIEAMGDDPRGWLAGQVDEAPPAPPTRPVADELRRDSSHLQRELVAERDARRARDEAAAEDIARRYIPLAKRVDATLAAQKLDVAMRTAATKTPYRERLTGFWTNHFSVLPKNRLARSAVPYFSQAAIAPFATAPFVDLLFSAIRHPAMQIYLDSIYSVGPNSPEGRERGQGLNENLARELLELHTLGVDGGYTQDDVIALAKGLTGWAFHSLLDEENGWNFEFRAERHEPGPLTLLGKTYPDRGVETAELMLRDLARHPATARHLATKLVRHFVDDRPPEKAVAKLARIYLDTEGDLAAVSKTLAGLDEARHSLFSKLKQPGDLVISSFRAFDIEMTPQLATLAAEHQAAMGQPPFMPPGPQGWYDTAADWNDPSSLRRRVDWGVELARRTGGELDVAAAMERNFGSRLDRDTRVAVTRAPTRREAAAILLASPMFQRR